MDVMRVTAGMSRASKPPRRKRQMKREAKPVQAAMEQARRPQQRTKEEK
jgi:hypothetical protein